MNHDKLPVVRPNQEIGTYEDDKTEVLERKTTRSSGAIVSSIAAQVVDGLLSRAVEFFSRNRPVRNDRSSRLNEREFVEDSSVRQHSNSSGSGMRKSRNHRKQNKGRFRSQGNGPQNRRMRKRKQNF